MYGFGNGINVLPSWILSDSLFNTGQSAVTCSAAVLFGSDLKSEDMDVGTSKLARTKAFKSKSSWSFCCSYFVLISAYGNFAVQSTKVLPSGKISSNCTVANKSPNNSSAV